MGYCEPCHLSGLVKAVARPVVEVLAPWIDAGQVPGAHLQGEWGGSSFPCACL